MISGTTDGLSRKLRAVGHEHKNQKQNPSAKVGSSAEKQTRSASNRRSIMGAMETQSRVEMNAKERRP
jgi:hypothetical protein